MRRLSAALLFGGAWLFLLGSSGQEKPATIAPSSGKQLCSALSPADFNKAGVPVTALRQANVDDPASAYCVYDNKSGKVEFDIFYPAGDTAEAVKGTEKTVLREVGGKFEPIPVTGADSAEINLAVPGNPVPASICVRKGSAVFTLNLPQTTEARGQLLTLAQTVLSRLR
jgi:hypothetical protein